VTFLRRGEGTIRNDIARLAGSRLVTGSEANRGEQIDAAVVKQLTGGDVVTARYLFSEAFEFRPTFKIVLLANHRPRVEFGDDAIWRRLLLVPFTNVVPPEKRSRVLKRELTDLKLAGPTILRWAVEGCLKWQRAGLAIPREIEAGTEAYKAEMDVVGHFIGECCEVHPDRRVDRTALFAAFRDWLRRTSPAVRMDNREFYGELERRSYVLRKSNGVNWVLGVGLAGEPSPQ
jgi:putative DNA primase/helicase